MVIRHTLQVESHTLVALSFNPETAGRPIILLHGICGSISYWTPELVTPFALQGPCYALSLPGHYPAVFSPEFNRADLTAETLARLLGRAIYQLVGKQPVILVGYSTGGFAALNLAAHIPERVQAVISIAGFAHGQWIGLLGRSQALARQGWPGSLLFKFGLGCLLRIRAMQRASLHFFTGKNHPRATYLIDPKIDRSLLYADELDLTAMESYFAMLPNIDISRLLSRITAPTLALTGDSDPIVPPEQSYLIAQKIPHADLALIRGAGHLPFLETPIEYGQTLSRWLSRI